MSTRSSLGPKAKVIRRAGPEFELGCIPRMRAASATGTTLRDLVLLPAEPHSTSSVRGRDSAQLRRASALGQNDAEAGAAQYWMVVASGLHRQVSTVPPPHQLACQV